MLRRNKNFIIAYVLLVGLPGIILIGILRIGSKLAAPLSIEGVWKVETNVAPVAALLCLEPSASAPEISLVISQSGKDVALNVGAGPGGRAPGVIEGNVIKTSPLRLSRSEGCANLLPALTAIVDPNTVPRSLAGTLSANGCPSCAHVDFRAVRQSPTPSH
jgi:hypothetical protein